MKIGWVLAVCCGYCFDLIAGAQRAAEAQRVWRNELVRLEHIVARLSGLLEVNEKRLTMLCFSHLLGDAQRLR